MHGYSASFPRTQTNEWPRMNETQIPLSSSTACGRSSVPVPRMRCRSYDRKTCPTLSSGEVSGRCGVRDVSIADGEGEVFGIMGLFGSGKSTLSLRISRLI